MRVLDTWTGQFVEIDPKALDCTTIPWEQVFKYAILSHTWDQEGEQTYQELREIQKRYPPPQNSDPSDPLSYLHFLFRLPSTSGQPATLSIWDDPELSPKIREACRVAQVNGYRYIWIDSCCIDKTSSFELSESINSMYEWYARSDVCYAFLPDVPAEEDHRQEGSRFRESRWFRRGWTLQELIAPRKVHLLSKEWKFIGSKEDLVDLVVEITKIHHNALLNIEPLDKFSVAQRFSWAARRETTREEDGAYSLLGLFDINMPTLYGEGERAFRRLQEEIMRRTPDQSLFAWTFCGLPDPASQLHEPGAVTDSEGQRRVELWRGELASTDPFLASSLSLFQRCTDIRTLSQDPDEVACRLQLHPSELPTIEYTFTPHGIRTQFPVISVSDYCLPLARHIVNANGIPLSQWYLVILGCGHKDFPRHLLARICFIQSSGSRTKFLHPGWMEGLGSSDFDLLPLSPAAITRVRSSGGHISIKTLYIPQPKRVQKAHDIARYKRHETIKLVLSEMTHESLSSRGYTATLRSPDNAHPRTHSITLSHDTHTITMDYQHTLRGGGGGGGDQELTIKAHVKTSVPVLQDAGTPSPGDPRVLQADGLRSVVSWWDSTPWWEKRSVQDVELEIPGRSTPLTVLRLSLTLAKTNYYVLDIELKTPGDPILADAPVAEIQDTMDGRPGS